MANFLMRPMTLPPPPPRYPKMEYHMETSGRWLAIDWHGGTHSQWTEILNCIKSLPQKRYDGKTKKWMVPATESVMQWLRVAGWGADEMPKFHLPEPVIAPPLDKTRVLEGLYPYQVEFLRFSQGKPRLCLWDGMGCIDGNATVLVRKRDALSSREMPLETFYKHYCRQTGAGWQIWCMQGKTFGWGDVADVLYKGPRQCVELKMPGHRTLICTPDHKVRTRLSWEEARSLRGMQVACNKKKLGSHDKVRYTKVFAVAEAGEHAVYDVRVVDHANFVASGVVVHNCGKTLQALAWIRYHRLDPVLIVVNAATKLQWQANYHQWLDGVWDHEIDVLTGKTPRRLEAGKSYIINWDILTYWQDALANHKFRGVVADEAQAVGDKGSKRTKAFMEIAKSAPFLLAMSGTPARSRPVQLWPVLHCINPKVFENFFAFAEYFGAPKETPFGRVYPGASHAKELHAELQKIAIRRLKEDVLKDLPRKTRSIVPMETDSSLMDVYNHEEDSMTGDETGAVLKSKLESLTGFAYDAKAASVKAWLRDFLDSEEKLVVYAWHRAVVEGLAEELKDKNPAVLYGGMTDTAREAAKDRFIKDESCRVLIANIQSGGVGIDGLQKVCCNCCFVECSVVPADHDQAEDRLCRIGQELPVTCYYCVAPGTIDDDLIAILDRKANTLSKVIDGHKVSPEMLLQNIMQKRFSV